MGAKSHWQYFSGGKVFQWKLPIEPTDLVHFRKRIGQKSVEKILEISIRMHGQEAQEAQVVVDTTVQEKNITYQKHKARKHFRTRAAIEPHIGHLKSQYGLDQCKNVRF